MTALTSVANALGLRERPVLACRPVAGRGLSLAELACLLDMSRPRTTKILRKSEASGS